MKLSILDQSLIPFGGNAANALKETIELAIIAEELGYHRFWVSEHHNLSTIAGASPELLMVKIADATKNIRVGSGGIMLPNHSALKVAENFRLLEGLFPGRIDLGIGRAPGGDRITAALLNPSNDFSEQSYLRQLEHLRIFFKDEAGTEYGRIIAVPQIAGIPQQWILSSSGGSGKIAAQYGMGLVIARFINGKASASIAREYIQSYTPSDTFPDPTVALSIVVLCSKSQEKADRLKKSVDHMLLQMESGKREGIYNVADLKNYTFSYTELEHLKQHAGKVVWGTPGKVKEELLSLTQEFGAEEIIAVTWAAQFEDRIESFELLTKAFQ